MKSPDIHIVNDIYFYQKRKQMKTVNIEGTEGLTDMITLILNNYTSLVKADFKI